MVTASARDRVRERIEQICKHSQDSIELRLAVLGELRQVVGFDAYAWLLTDPGTSVGAAPLADVPCLPELPTLIRLKYLTAVNRWTTIDEPPVARLQDATQGRPSDSLLFRDLLSRYDVGDVALAVYRDRFGCWGFLDLWRIGRGARFSADDAAFLADVAGPVTAALRRSQAGTFVVPASPDSQIGPVVLLLSADLRVLAQTPQTSMYLRTLVPPAGDAAPIPASAYNVAAQLLAVELGVDRNEPSARVHLADGRWVTLRADRIGDSGDSGPPSERDIAVTIEGTSPAERQDLFARAFGLSTRETELLGLLATGAGTRELAGQMYLSEHTVQDHLKSIFAKTSARSRPTLLSWARGR